MSPLRRVVLILAVWGAATAFGVAFAALTEVGPVLLTLSHRHGVHVGDLLAIFASYTAAAVSTWQILRQREAPTRRHRRRP